MVWRRHLFEEREGLLEIQRRSRLRRRDQVAESQREEWGAWGGRDGHRREDGEAGSPEPRLGEGLGEVWADEAVGLDYYHLRAPRPTR